MTSIDKLCVNTMRTLTADAVEKAKSGHPGLAIGSAPLAFTLWKNMRHNPKNPAWQGRDRFVLSSGHASMLEYSLLHIFGYGVSIDDIKSFRQWGSLTPGHPEFRHTPGVEATTGPLGQGFGMAVGMAMAETHLAAHFNREGYNVVDNYTYVLMGDGCMMEGAQSEAASMAGTMKLSKLIAFYDSNRITIEGSTDIAFTENVAKRYAAYGWQVITVDDGENMTAIAAAIGAAKAEKSMPSLIIVNTEIAAGTPKAGKASAHGAPLGEETITAYKESIDWPLDKPFYVPDEVYEYTAKLQEGFTAMNDEYDKMFDAYKKAYPELYKEWCEWHSDKLPEALLNDESLFACEGAKATRNISGDILNKLAGYLPNLFGGSADLSPSNMTVMKERSYFSADDREGANIHFGVRELAMACAANGIAIYGGLRAYCATFMVFSDYVKPALRLSACMNLPVIYVLTHDSIGVGEDGPTHEPIEQLASLRATPKVLTFRPADQTEAASCYLAALQAHAPSAMVLTRQALPQLPDSSKLAMRGGYVLRDPKGEPDVVLIASGSEVDLIYKAADILAVQGYTTRLVSMPSTDVFDAQDEAYRESVLPKNLRKRVAVEAGTSFGWHKYTGLDGDVVSIDSFGSSAPYKVLFEKFGFTAENVAARALAVIKK